MSLISITTSTTSQLSTLVRAKVLTSNEKTLLVYEKNAQEYLSQTPLKYSSAHIPLIRWLDIALSSSPGINIFEIGSGHGRDARYMKENNYNVLCSDATKAFVDYLNNNGQRAINFNVLTDEMPRIYDMVFANSVIPHFTVEELEVCLAKIHESLNKGGVLALSAKQGRGEAWINEKLIDRRFVHYWQPDSLTRKINSAGFEITYIDKNIIGGDIPNHTWIQLIARKV